MSPYSGHHICGLYYINSATFQRAYLPQVQLKSHTTINPVCFTTQLTQTFHNPNAESLEQVRYTFPLYDGVAVNGYTISYGDKVLKGVVKQKDDAKKTYQAAVDRGETAGLLESLPAGTFGVTLGNVPSKTDIVVDITYCGELKHDAAIDGLRYMLPTSIAPRYGDYPGELLKSNAVSKGRISITVDVDMAKSAIRKIQSPSHPIAVSMGAMSNTERGDQAPFIPSQASATLTLGSTELGQDFVLQLLIDDISKPQAILETHPTLPNQRALMTTFVPKFTLEPMYPEICFIADQSGSMGGSKNTALVSALKVFLKSLPLGVRFNICAFGNDFKFLFPKSQAYNEDNVNTALAFVDSFTASYGGTQILEPITAAFEQRLSDLPLEVMLLTDGEVWNENGVFDFVNEQIHKKSVDARVFALGIGSDVSHTLVEGVARAGNGFAQFVTQSEDTDQKVVRMLKGALYAHTNDYSVEVNYGEDEEDTMTDEDDFEIVEKINDSLYIDDKEPTQEQKGGDAQDGTKTTSFFDKDADVDKPLKAEGGTGDRYSHLPIIDTPKLLQAPNKIPSMFPFNRTTLYVLLGPQSAQKSVKSLTLRATSAQGPLELVIPVTNSANPSVAITHQLAARKAIQDLEEGRGWIQAAKTIDGQEVKTKYMSREDEIVERECVRLGEKFQVAGKWTSFVAIEDQCDHEENMEIEGQTKELSEARLRSHNTTMAKKKMSLAHSQSASHAMREQPDRLRYVDPHSSLFSSSSSLFGRGQFGSSRCTSGGTGSSFGFPPETASNEKGLFGSSQAPGNTSASLFGANQNTPGVLFGSSSDNCNSGGSLFDCGGAGNKQDRRGPSGNYVHPTRDRAIGLAPGRSFTGFGTKSRSRASSSFGADHHAHPAKFETAAVAQSFGSDQLTSPSSHSAAYLAPQHYASASHFQTNPPPSPVTKFAAAPPMPRSARFTSASAAPDAAEEIELSDDDMGFGLFDGDDEDDLYDEAVQTSAAPRKQLASMAARRVATPGHAFLLADEDDLYETASFDATETMHAIIGLQTFAGGWQLNDQLLAKLGIAAANVNKAELGGNDEVCATVLAIAFFEVKVSQKNSVWELVVEKAKAWLEKQSTKQQIDEIVKKAGTYFKDA